MQPPQESTDRAGRFAAFQRLALLTTLATLLLVAIGGAVRATDSGLACPDWPFCYGKIIPRQADIPPETGYTLWNVWLEHSHRLLASAVGLAVLVLAVWALRRFRDRRDILLPSVGAFVFVSLQGALGAFVVLRQLLPELVTAHLGMAMIVLACLVYLTVSLSHPRLRGRSADLGYARASAAVAGLALVQILVGGHVTGIGAGLIWQTFPLMDGTVFPAVASEAAGFHLAHRWFALVLLIASSWLCWRAVVERRRRQQAGSWDEAGHRWLVKLPMYAASLVVVQIVIGVANLFSQLSAFTVIPHLAVASWIWTTLALLTVLAYRLAPDTAAGRTAPAVARVPAGEVRA